MPEPYTYEDIEMGIVNKEIVRVAYMPRADFLKLVDDLLEKKPVDFTGRLRPIAETMPTFPMSEWIDPVRGCGCVVGEYLVAANIINREEFAPGSKERQPSVYNVLMQQEDGQALDRFGYQIDRYVTSALRDRMRNYMEFAAGASLAVVFID